MIIFRFPSNIIRGNDINNLGKARGKIRARFSWFRAEVLKPRAAYCAIRCAVFGRFRANLRALAFWYVLRCFSRDFRASLPLGSWSMFFTKNHRRRHLFVEYRY
jgi:hypothetical protein